MNRAEKMAYDFRQKLTPEQQAEVINKRAMAVHVAIVDLINAGATDIASKVLA